MRYEVRLTADAEHDLEATYEYIAVHDSATHAVCVLDRLTNVAEKLSTLPERGVVPPELRPLGMIEFRQLYFKPYCVIYRIDKDQAIIYVIADGRQNMQALLSRRLLAG